MTDIEIVKDYQIDYLIEFSNNAFYFCGFNLDEAFSDLTTGVQDSRDLLPSNPILQRKINLFYDKLKNLTFEHFEIAKHIDAMIDKKLEVER